jgi:hypothetical protein
MESSGKLIAALEEFPNLANRTLVMLLGDEENAQKVKQWIAQQADCDMRFALLAERAGITICKQKDLVPCVVD